MTTATYHGFSRTGRRHSMRTRQKISDGMKESWRWRQILGRHEGLKTQVFYWQKLLGQIAEAVEKSDPRSEALDDIRQHLDLDIAANLVDALIALRAHHH
jgi:hypothetical protein